MSLICKAFCVSSVCCMELMHNFVKGVCVLQFWEVHVSRGSDYLICNARAKWMVKHYKLNDPGPHSHYASIELLNTMNRLTT